MVFLCTTFKMYEVTNVLNVEHLTLNWSPLTLQPPQMPGITRCAGVRVSRLRLRCVTTPVLPEPLHHSIYPGAWCHWGETRVGWVVGGRGWEHCRECVCRPSICQCEHTKIWFKLQVCIIQYTCYESCHLRYIHSQFQ